MVTRNNSNKETKELEKYIKNKFNLEIYEDIEENPHLFNCKPLKFFQTLEKSLSFIQQNRKNFLSINQHLKANFPNRAYFLKKLSEALKREINGYDLTDDQKKVKELADMFDKSHFVLEELLEIVSKKALEAERNEPLATDLRRREPVENTTIENTLSDETNSQEKIGQREARQKKSGLTLDRAIFLLTHLLSDFQNCDATKKAEFITALTGYNYETVRQRFSTINNKHLDKSKAFNNDMKFVIKHLDLLGFNEVVKELKNDINFK